jgi:hypothetical protein
VNRKQKLQEINKLLNDPLTKVKQLTPEERDKRIAELKAKMTAIEIVEFKQRYEAKYHHVCNIK